MHLFKLESTYYASSYHNGEHSIQVVLFANLQLPFTLKTKININLYN